MVKINGFTLIELLIVVAIMGVLAVVTLVALNPIERQASTRDAGRISGVTQLGRVVESFYASSGGTSYPSEDIWAQEMLDSGDLSSFPQGIIYNAYSTTGCATFVQPATNPTFCYSLDDVNGALIFTRLEANGHNNKCSAPEVAYFAYSTADGRAGTVCSENDPSPWASGAQTYAD